MPAAIGFGRPPGKPGWCGDGSLSAGRGWARAAPAAGSIAAMRSATSVSAVNRRVGFAPAQPHGAATRARVGGVTAPGRGRVGVDGAALDRERRAGGDAGGVDERRRADAHARCAAVVEQLERLGALDQPQRGDALAELDDERDLAAPRAEVEVGGVAVDVDGVEDLDGGRA